MPTSPNPPEGPLTQPSPTGWGEEQERRPTSPNPPEGPLISIFSHRMGRRGRIRIGLCVFVYFGHRKSPSGVGRALSIGG